MTEIYPSTMALSVYNVLSLAKRDLPRDGVESFLRASFDQNLAEDYVSRGCEYLFYEGLAREEKGLIVIDRLPDGRGKPVVRSSDDRALMKAAY